MNTRIPQFLIDFSRWLKKSLSFRRSKDDGQGNHKQRRQFARAKLRKQCSGDVSGTSISYDRMIELINRDSRKNQSFLNAVETGYLAKIARVRAGKGKNTLSGIRFSA
jgi:hypothetical protein